MSPFGESTLAAAQRHLDNAVAKIEEYCDSPADSRDPTLIAGAFADMLRCRGNLHAAAQLEYLSEGMTDSTRPSPLRLVK